MNEKNKLFFCRNDHSQYLGSFSRTSFKLHQELAKELDGESQYGYRPLDTYSVVFDPKGKASKDSLDWTNPSRSIEQIGTKRTTAQLHPGFFTRKLLEEAKRTGRVEIKIGRGVSKLIYENDRDIGGVVLEDGTELRADRVVVAMGPWSGKLPLMNDTIPISGSHVHSIVLQPKDKIPGQALFTTIMHESKTFEPEVSQKSLLFILMLIFILFGLGLSKICKTLINTQLILYSLYSFFIRMKRFTFVEHLIKSHYPHRPIKLS